MDSHQVDVQVLSVMPELFSYWATVGEAKRFSLAMNEWVAEAVARYPNRFVGLGIVPLQDVDTACELLSRVKSSGLAGVEIGSNVEGTSAAEIGFLPFYKEAERLDLAIFVHSFHPAYGRELIHREFFNSVTFPLEIGYFAASVVTNGILDACPKLRVALSHGGGNAALAIPRLQSTWERNESLRNRLHISPLEHFSRLYYDSLLFDHRAIQYLIQMVGVERVVVGSDYPFLDMQLGMDAIPRDIDPGLRHLMFTDNALAFLNIPNY